MADDLDTSVERSRALITETERDRIAGRTDCTDNIRYQAISRVRRRIDEELGTEIALLAEHHPELLAEVRVVVCDVDE